MMRIVARCRSDTRLDAGDESQCDEDDTTDCSSTGGGVGNILTSFLTHPWDLCVYVHVCVCVLIHVYKHRKQQTSKETQ